MIVIIAFIFPGYVVFAEIDTDRLFPYRFDSTSYIIDNVIFIGNESFSEDNLISALSIKGTNKSFIHRYFEMLSDGLVMNKSTPQKVISSLDEILKAYKDVIQFVSSETILADSISLYHYYNMRGFHNVEIHFNLQPDSSNLENNLIYTITENDRYTVDTVVYHGLNTLPIDVNSSVNQKLKIWRGLPFNELEIFREIKEVQNLLLNSGYYYAYFDIPPLVKKDIERKSNTVDIWFHPGIRQRIGDIHIIDSTYGQPKVSDIAKEELLMFKKGDWYNYSNIKLSEENIRYLGTFNAVNIDTFNIRKDRPDSVLDFKVLSGYRKLQDWSVGLFLNKTIIDKSNNIGVEGEYTHRNIGGIAQVFNPYVRAFIRDYPRFFQDIYTNFEPEGQIGFKWAQPLLWVLDGSKIGLYSNTYYSVRSIESTFPLHTFTLPLKFTAKQPSNTYINDWSVEFIFERQQPYSFDTVLNRINDPDISDELRNRYANAFIQYNLLYKYFNSKDAGLFSASLMSLSAVADQRDNFFNPSKGSFTTISVEFPNPLIVWIPYISGLAKYMRAQWAFNNFQSVYSNTILAVKGKIGHIITFEKDNDFVPIDRQFYGGGANSVRGWDSRKLRYTDVQPEPDSTGRDDAYTFSENNIGNSTIIEGSIELRYSFPDLNYVDNLITEQISKMGITVFADIGNAFGWFSDNITQTKFTDYITKLGIAAGFGLRYDTPIGPVRFDIAWPLYDPNIVKTPTNAKFHFAIGHSF